MVNTTSTTIDRRAAKRVQAKHEGVLGPAKLNPFGDLHTLQHLSVRLVKSLRGVFEPMLRREVRCWAEPLAVQRFADYRAERPDSLTGWLPLEMASPALPARGQALIVLDGQFILELLDLFFGGTGSASPELPREFSGAADALVERLGRQIAGPLSATWEPLAKIEFTVGHPETNPAMLADIDSDDAVIVTRFGIASGIAAPVHLDIVYPVAALKPHGTALTGKVVGSAEPDPGWRNGLTRAAMHVRFPVRSVLAEPIVKLSMLMDLKAGDVIPISFGPEVPVMVGRDCLGVGTVGAANGKAAVRLTRLNTVFDEENA